MEPLRVLHLIYRGNLFLVHPGGHRVQLGRDDGNDIVILSLFASRRHAEVRAEGGHFILEDRSTNGTFLLAEDHSREQRLEGGQAVLAERGWLGIGRSALQHGEHSLRYSVQEEHA